MFQTNINHLLQDFTNDFTIWFMNLISSMGSLQFYLAIIFIIMFGWDLKKGFIVIHIFIWASLINNVLKESFRLPRPLDIDETLKNFGTDFNHINIDGANHSPNGFFKAISPEIIEKCRSAGIASPGFPSGHVVSAASFWTTTGWMVCNKWIWAFAILFILLTMISRLFLGAHFIADVTGGLINGLIISFIGLLVFPFINTKSKTQGNSDFFTTLSGRMLVYSYFLIIPVILSFLPYAGIAYTAPLLGINLVILTSPLSFINEHAKLWQRILRVLIAIVIFMGITKLFSFLPPPKATVLQFFLIATHYFISFRLSIYLCSIAGLYKKLEA